MSTSVKNLLLRYRWLVAGLLLIVVVAWLISMGYLVQFENPPMTQQEMDNLNNPPADVVVEVEGYLDAALGFIVAAEQRGRVEGRPLTASEIEFASSLGVMDISAVRIVATANFPVPSDEAFHTEFVGLGLNSSANNGITLGHTVFVRPRYDADPCVINHELVHVLQVERLGSTEFVRQVLVAGNVLRNWNNMPLEVEAYALSGGCKR
jgi:hypothetical protein